MANYQQQQLNLIIAALANGQMIDDLTEQVNITDSATVLAINDGTANAKKANIAKVRGFLGTWDASTNTPTLADGTGVSGDRYKVSAAGTVNFGSGDVEFKVGDYAIYDGAVWASSVTSVGVLTENSTGVAAQTEISLSRAPKAVILAIDKVIISSKEYSIVDSDIIVNAGLIFAGSDIDVTILF